MPSGLTLVHNIYANYFNDYYLHFLKSALNIYGKKWSFKNITFQIIEKNVFAI